ncbi:hypothetical protein OH77DRAFT_293351 [Trametes cingulata]|nr:hypothetical protein OH77DRAFT_293351 [Trametes cingulata]
MPGLKPVASTSGSLLVFIPSNVSYKDLHHAERWFSILSMQTHLPDPAICIPHDLRPVPSQSRPHPPCWVPFSQYARNTVEIVRPSVLG